MSRRFLISARKSQALSLISLEELIETTSISGGGFTLSDAVRLRVCHSPTGTSVGTHNARCNFTRARFPALFYPSQRVFSKRVYSSV